MQSTNVHEYEHGVAHEQPTPMLSNNSNTSKYYVGKIAPSRRSLLDEISSKKWNLHRVGKKSLRDRSAVNPEVWKGIAPETSTARRSLLDELNSNKWRLNFVRNADIKDRSEPNLHLGFDQKPDLTPNRKKLYADIKGKNSKLSSVSKSQLHDRSAPNPSIFIGRDVAAAGRPQAINQALLADIKGKNSRLSSVSKSKLHDRSAPNPAIFTKKESVVVPQNKTFESARRAKIGKQRKPDTMALFSDINGKRWNKLRRVSNSDMHDRSAPNLSMLGQKRNQTILPTTTSNIARVQPQPHLHSTVNSAFPVSEYYARNHNDGPANWRGETVGKKVSSLGKGFAGWIKEEFTEAKDALKMRKHNNAIQSANNTSVVGTDFTAPGSSVNSGLKQEPIINTTLTNHANENQVRGHPEYTIY